MEQEVEGWYKNLTVILLLAVALPIAGYVTFPNSITYSLFFPVSIFITSIHELGHFIPYMVLSIFGAQSDSARFIIVAGGTIFQILVPMLFVTYFLAVNRKYALACISLVLLGGSIYLAGHYMSTAQAPSGAAITPFGTQVQFESDPSIHDWRYMLSTLNLLGRTPELSKFTMDFSYVLILVGIFSATLETNMLLNGSRTKDFMIVLLYGTVPTFLLSFLYFNATKFLISLIFFIISFAYFLAYKAPILREEYEEAEEEEEKESRSS